MALDETDKTHNKAGIQPQILNNQESLLSATAQQTAQNAFWVTNEKYSQDHFIVSNLTFQIFEWQSMWTT